MGNLKETRWVLESAKEAVGILRVAAVCGALAALSASAATDRGDRVREVLERYVDAGRISGVVSAVSDRSGNVRFDCVGWADVERRVPMATNTMFAVFSMTKTFNGAAIMAAIDDGAMSLEIGRAHV